MTSVDGLGRVGTLRSLATGALGFLAVGITASHQGAYFPPAWGWSALGFLLVVAAVLVFRGTLEIARLRLIFLAGMASLVLWTTLSLVWSASIPRTIDEIERSIIYVAAIAALFALAS